MSLQRKFLTRYRKTLFYLFLIVNLFTLLFIMWYTYNSSLIQRSLEQCLKDHPENPEICKINVHIFSLWDAVFLSLIPLFIALIYGLQVPSFKNRATFQALLMREKKDREDGRKGKKRDNKKHVLQKSSPKKSSFLASFWNYPPWRKFMMLMAWVVIQNISAYLLLRLLFTINFDQTLFYLWFIVGVILIISTFIAFLFMDRFRSVLEWMEDLLRESLKKSSRSSKGKKRSHKKTRHINTDRAENKRKTYSGESNEYVPSKIKRKRSSS